jgi:hypothetical protein
MEMIQIKKKIVILKVFLFIFKDVFKKIESIYKIIFHNIFLKKKVIINIVNKHKILC